MLFWPLIVSSAAESPDSPCPCADSPDSPDSRRDESDVRRDKEVVAQEEEVLVAQGERGADGPSWTRRSGRREGERGGRWTGKIFASRKRGALFTSMCSIGADFFHSRPPLHRFCS